VALSQFSQLDLQLIPLLNMVAEPIAGDLTASSANIGRIYRNTSTGALRYVRDATTVVTLSLQGQIVDSDIAAGAAIAIAKLAVNPLARANHTGTQLAATVSDFDAQVNTHKVTDLTAPTTALSLNNQKITNLADPTVSTDAATMNFVQNLVSSTVNGQDWKNSVRVAALTNITIASPGASIDGVALNAGDRVLLAGQTTASQNGIYVWNGSAVPMTRGTDANSSATVTAGMTVPVTEGTYDNQIAILTTNDAITLGTTSLAFTFLTQAATYTAGTGITITGSSIALTVPVTVALGGTGAITAAGARTNLVVPQRGYAADLPALTAGVANAVVHSLATLDVNCQVYRKSDGASVNIATARSDVNTVTVTSDIAVATGALRLVVTPIA
jgi:hypothetical protein